ncbi:pth [Symbiodinium natans]|uniref:Pth protein n=1 Tax=Symbiodinium natans TaxID=878477 RepID=A0A812HPF1_9DINO|nr:pth [Symbiodinium natans]
MAAALVGNTLPSAALQLGKELQHPLRRARISPQASRASQAYSRGLKPTAACGALGFLGALAPTRRRPTARRAGPTPVDKVAESTLAVVGLGNVGARFDGTRHNIGFAAVDEIASKLLSTDRWTLSSSIWQERCYACGEQTRKGASAEPRR